MLLMISPLLAFLLVAWTLPEQAGIEAYDQQRLLQIICLLATSGCYLLVRSARVSVHDVLARIPPLDATLLGVGFVIGLISALASRLPVWAAIEWALFLQLGLLVAVIAATRSTNTNREYRALAGTITVSAAAYALILMAGFAAFLAHNQVIDLTTFHPRFSNPRFPGQMFSMFVPLLIAFAMRRERLRWIPWLTASIFTCFVLSQGTRGTWLAMAVAMTLIVVVKPNGHGPFLRAWIGSCAFGIVLYLALAHLLPGLLDKSSMSGLARASSVATLTDDSLRLVLWRHSVAETVSHPTLGIGPMHFAAATSLPGLHPHNVLLQIGTEWGLIALICLVLPLLRMALSFLKLTRNPQRSAGTDSMVNCGLLAALAAGMTQSLVDGILVVPTSQVTFALVVGLVAGRMVAQYEPRESRKPVTRSTRYVVGVSTLLSAVMLAGVGLKGPPPVDAYQVCNKPGILLPRFWSHGAIGPQDFPAPPFRCPQQRPIGLGD
jgi:O-antigen ligase